MSTVVEPGAMDTFAGFRRALLASAPTAEIPVDLVEAALEKQEWF